ncbi:cytochrome P450 oxidoreductase [Leptodontidium sp. 2 PMI_412]|nr:cytochrome P450 oxidoreductase [Leptodontidium sp. 2 PMI_412]
MAVLNVIFKIPLSAWGLLIFLLLTSHFVRNRFRPVLYKVPGPFIASFTDFWRLYDVARGHHHDALIRLHREYESELVRIGPNTVSVADPEAVKVIYGLNKGFTKSDFYVVQQAVSQGKPLENLFNTVREDFHAAIRRPVAHAYSMTTLVQFEPFVDTTSQVFCRRLTELFAGTRKVCDLGKWLQYYAFDVIGEITFSKRFGFLETGSDIEGIIADLEWRLVYFATCGQIPILDRLLLKSPLAMRVIPTNHVVKFTLQHIKERLAKPVDRKDFLSMFLKAKELYPDVVTDRQVMSYSVSNVFAGSDTTAISLRSVLYYLLKNPRILMKVVAEIDDTVGDRDCSQLPISFNESNRMPYFQAVLKEGMRMHPAVGLLLERKVPENGAIIAGTWLPGGTTVGINPWVLHRNKRVFGEDADCFRPERWLEADPETLRAMDRSFLAFGSGPRTCIGKNISLLEMAKIIPQLLWTFEFELAEPEEEWKLLDMWFVKQTNFSLNLKARPGRGIVIDSINP